MYATCLRRTKEAARDSVQLPQIHEKVQSVQLSESDRELYNFFQKHTADLASGSSSAGAKASGDRNRHILPLLNFLRLICDHGPDLLPIAALNAWDTRQWASFDWKDAKNSRLICGFCRFDLEQVEQVGTRKSIEWECGHQICGRCLSQREDACPEDTETGVCSECLESEAKPESAGQDSFPRQVDHCPSAKMKALLLNLSKEHEGNANLVGIVEPVKR